MSSNRPVNDTDILNGFASISQAVADGFDRLGRRIEAVEQKVDGLTTDVARMEHRILRRFDDVDERFDRLEVRVTALEARTA